ncbi:MAG: hypothetical protein M3460_07910 [Actinomycetota bacterium]|nr:hypothetical protein [Actinomycetota bacterium]
MPRGIVWTCSCTRHATAEVIEFLAAGIADLRAARSEHATVLSDLAAAVEQARNQIGSALTSIDVDLRALRDQVTAAAHGWPALVTDLEAELRRIQRGLGGQLDAQRYINAVQQRTALQPIVDNLARHEQELQELQTQRQELLRRLQDQRRDAFQRKFGMSVAVLAGPPMDELGPQSGHPCPQQ